MSSIKKLSIQGVRSFTCEKPESIAFGTPLTLICGANGSGKTTVIECLKYATTGFLPPNSKGGAFINDPNITQRNSVSAQIKLFFTSVTGEPYVITRTMQLTKKGKDKYAFKTLENQLEKSVRGERTSVSAKSSDIDNELPNYLGITKPILDYVIFCHQDESLWPLSEPSLLKKKFDDIFQASKFTKILDNLKVINKDLSVDIKLLEKSVEHLKVDKKRSKKIVDNLNNLKTQIEDLNEEIGNLSMEIDEKESKLEKLFNSNQDFQSVLSKYEQMSFNRTSLSQQFERLKESIEILPDDISTLLDKLNNFDKVIAEYNAEVDSITKETVSLNFNVTENQLKLNELNKLQGSLGFKEKQYNESLQSLNEILDDELGRQGFHDQLRSELDKMVEEFKDLQKANKTGKSEKSKRIQSIHELISIQSHSRQIKLDSTKEFTSKIRDLEGKITSSNLSDDNLKDCELELEKLQKKYDDSRKSNFLLKLEKEIDQNSSKLNDLEIQYDDYNKKIQSFNNQSELMNKINNTQDLIRHQENSNTSNLKKLQDLISEITIDNFDTKFSQSYGEAKSELESLKEAHDKNLNLKNSIDIKIQLNDSKSFELSDELEKTKSKISEVISENEIDNYESISKEAEDDLNNSVETLKTFEVSKNFRIKAVEVSQQSHNCLLCQRSFNEHELKKFIEYLNNEVKNMSREQVTAEYKEAKADYEMLKSIQPDVVRYKSLVNEVKQSETTKKEALEKLLKDIESQCAKSEEVLTSGQEKFNGLNDHKHLVEEIRRSKNQLKLLKEKLDASEKELNEVGIKESLSIDELNKSVNDVNFEIKSIRNKLSSDKELKFNKERELNKLSGNIKDMEIKIKNIESELSDLKNFKNLITDYQISISKQNLEIEDIEQKLTELNKEKDIEVSNYERLVAQYSEEEQQKKAHVDKIRQRFETFSDLYKKVEQFEQSDLPLLKQNQSDIVQLTNDQEALSIKIAECSKKLKIVEKKINESTNLKSIFRDNIDYRNLQTEISTLDEEISKLNIQEAETQKNQYQSESKKLRDLITNLNSENSYKIGQVKQIKEQVKSLRSELNSEYKDVEHHYHEEWIKLQTNMLISNDLVTYSKSVDNAIMKYHSIKMEEINRMLRYLWSSTYQGTDIDFIAIKSDMNSQNKGNRSYNYRVVMQKGKVELDMRGRCSAGQRVLTSILIRLTLAECFGSHCGMITLDEPTTNLDEENSRSLAESLNRIVESRREQDNFQIIIITHDQKFLSHINADSCEYFYKIQRDNNQASEIKAVPIFQLQDE
ncbi:DNA repair protein rad50 [Yamadazyma tenuis]|uniref:DNA repair protein rad50 n=1 Tax=Candida tenuis TaxID=2315449 RepID=UPI002797E96B|nr:DNA repair protein rad50 [Yamadazyma tenuis]